jgi:hypothetical protein
MNAHAAIDRAVIPVTRLFLGGYRLFSESLDGASFDEHLAGIGVAIPAFAGEGVVEVPMRTLRGDVDPAFVVAQWRGSTFPTILYHHGNNERPFDFGPLSKNSFKSVLLADRRAIAANLIAVRAPHHRSFKDYMREMGHLDAFVAMIAASCRLVEELRRRLVEEGGGRVTVSGFSLGGWVTNLHRALYGTADAYVPMAAGAALDDTVIDSAWSGTVAQTVRESEDDVRRRLNFERPFAANERDDVFALLARHDQYVRYEAQRGAYAPHALSTRDKGHVTLLADAAALRRHVLAHAAWGAPAAVAPAVAP